MGVIVQKFGGTSVGSIERIKQIAELIEKQNVSGTKLCIVVSAMGDSTDLLDGMAKQLSLAPSARELDMLLSTGEQVSTALLTIALQERGVKARGLTGYQAGITTTSSYGQAEITEIEKARIIEHLAKGEVVVVAGFQGVAKQGDITTLGRGGSDITAVALAAALKAERCDIYTDVNGVYTADPRLVPNARLLKQIGYDQMLEYAEQGAQVLHPRAVRWAKQHQIPLLIKSSFEESEGTWVLDEAPVSQIS